MLLQLPKELLINISSYLEFKDKLNLVSTCQRINEVIVQYNLYEKLTIPPDFHITRDIVKKFKNKKFNGTQVKRLQLDLNHLSNQQYRKLSAIFPNVAELAGNTGWKDNEKPRDDYVILPLLQWSNKIERYDMTKGLLQFFRLLETNNFSKLTHLTMNGLCMEEAKVKLISCFKNTPFLKTLELYNTKIDIELLEDLHSSCQQLKSLRLFDSFVILDDGTRLENNDIVAATSLSSLILEHSTTIYDRNCVFLDYIIAKYKNLCHFEFFSGFRPSEAYRDYAFYRRLGPFNHDPKVTQKVYNVEGARIILTLPRTLTTLKMDPHICTNVIEALDSGVLELKTLEFYCPKNSVSGKQLSQTVTNPNHLQYLQKTISLTTLTVGLRRSLLAYKEIISVSITKLTILVYSRSNNKSLNLEMLLSSFPSLKELNITVSKLSISGSKTNLIQYPHLYRLGILGIVNLHDGLFDYVRSVAPNITDLAWVICSEAAFIDPSPPAVSPITTTTRHSNTSPWNYQRHTDQSLVFWTSGQSIVADQLQSYESFHRGYDRSLFPTRPPLQQPPQQNQRRSRRDVIYTMDLSDKRMKILRLQTNFRYQGQFLMRVKTSDQTFGCSFRVFHRGQSRFISMVDQVTYRQSPCPEVIIKCGSIKKLIVDNTTIPLNNQL